MDDYIQSKNPIFIESCVESLHEAMRVSTLGIQSIELCSHLEVGGLTPSISLVREVVHAVDVDVKVMIRNRGGDFMYSPNDLSEMLHQINILKQENIKGIVFGALDINNTIHLENLKTIIKAASPLPITFHKAIDCTPNIIESVQILSKFPQIKYILSSGGAETADLGSTMLKAMAKVKSNHQNIIAAGRITSENLAYIREKTGLSHFHGRQIV